MTLFFINNFVSEITRHFEFSPWSPGGSASYWVGEREGEGERDCIKKQMFSKQDIAFSLGEKDFVLVSFVPCFFLFLIIDTT